MTCRDKTTVDITMNQQPNVQSTHSDSTQKDSLTPPSNSHFSPLSASHAPIPERKRRFPVGLLFTVALAHLRKMRGRARQESLQPAKFPESSLSLLLATKFEDGFMVDYPYGAQALPTH